MTREERLLAGINSKAKIVEDGGEPFDFFVLQKNLNRNDVLTDIGTKMFPYESIKIVIKDSEDAISKAINDIIESIPTCEALIWHTKPKLSYGVDSCSIYMRLFTLIKMIDRRRCGGLHKISSAKSWVQIPASNKYVGYQGESAY